MARILAIDYGKKRTGLAVTDPMQIIATGLTTVLTKELDDFLKQYCKEEEVEKFVIGDSKNLDNSPSEIAATVQKFSRKLQLMFPDIPQVWIDERFTSKMAKQSMIDSGMKKKKRQNKELVDEISATLILQTFMQTNLL